MLSTSLILTFLLVLFKIDSFKLFKEIFCEKEFVL